MDVLRRLTLEMDGMIGAILNYTDSPIIKNIAKNLHNAVKEKNIQETIYFLNKLEQWYEKNWNSILSNQYVFNLDEHKDIWKNIGDYIVELQKKIESESLHSPIARPNSSEGIKGDKAMINKIFISHSSKDEIFCTAFVDFLEGIGIPEDMILYTSSPRHGIPGDENIFKYLRNHIAEGITVFYMLSDNYYQSPYCLNEMGAAWITQNDFSTFLLPNFTEGIKGVIDSDIKAYTLSVPYDLISLKAKLTKQFNLKVSDGKFEDLKSKLLNSVSVKEIGS